MSRCFSKSSLLLRESHQEQKTHKKTKQNKWLLVSLAFEEQNIKLIISRESMRRISLKRLEDLSWRPGTSKAWKASVFEKKQQNS